MPPFVSNGLDPANGERSGHNRRNRLVGHLFLAHSKGRSRRPLLTHAAGLPWRQYLKDTGSLT